LSLLALLEAASRARALRSPCRAGISWGTVVLRETRDEQTGEIIEVLHPRASRLSAFEANGLLDRVSDIEVEVHFIDGNNFGIFGEGKNVKWADEEYNDEFGEKVEIRQRRELDRREDLGESGQARPYRSALARPTCGEV
jgi:hypothetical protein